MTMTVTATESIVLPRIKFMKDEGLWIPVGGREGYLVS